MEIRNDSGTPLVYTPFRVEEDSEPELLRGEDTEIPEEILPLIEMPDSEVILERNGLNFINDSVFSPDKETEENLDNDFRELVDSVIHPARKA